MGLAKNIKRCLGAIYAFTFSLALCGGLLNLKKNAIETSATFTGSFSISNDDIEYTPLNSAYIVTNINMNDFVYDGTGNYRLFIDIYGRESAAGGSETVRESGALLFTQGSCIDDTGSGTYGTYVGVLSGFCSEFYNGENSVSIRTYLSPRTVPTTGIWTPVEGNLRYETSSYEVSSADQTAVAFFGEGSYEVYYDIYGRQYDSGDPLTVMDQLTVHFTNTELLDEPYEQTPGSISGYCVEVSDTITLTINSLVYRSHQDGWTYLSGDKTLAYYDSTNPNGDYRFSSAYFTQYNCEAVIVYTGTRNGGSDPQTAHVWNAIYDYDSATISGTLALQNTQTWEWEATDTEVLLQFVEPGVVDEYYTEGWNFSQSLGEFIYYDEQEYSGLTAINSTFYEKTDSTSSYAVVSYSVTPEGHENEDPITHSFTVSNAKYVDQGNQYYEIIGTTTMTYQQVDYTFPVDFIVVGLTINREDGFYYNNQSYGFQYLWGDYGFCRTNLKGVIWNNFGTLDGGQQSQCNEIYLIYDVYDPENPSDTILNDAEVYLSNAVVTSMPGQETNDGYLRGYYLYESEPFVVAFNELTYQNDIDDGFNYLKGLDEIIFYSKQSDQRYGVSVTQATFDVYYSQFTVSATCTSTDEQTTFTDSFTLSSGQIYSQEAGEDGGIIKGKFQDTDTEITLEVPNIVKVNTLPLGWNYENSSLGYYDPVYKQSIPHEFSSAVYNEDYDQISITYIVKYSTVVQDERDSTQTILIKSPTITPIRAGGYSSYSVEGYCVEVDTTIRVVISSYDSVKSGWEYDESDGLFYYDSLLDTYVLHEFSSASYIVDNKEMLIDYTLKYSEVDQSSYDRSETITIKNPQITEQSAGTYTFYKVSGFCVEVNRDIELEIESYDELKASWEYFHPRELYAELIWNDPVSESMSMLTEANYNQDLGTVNFVYGIYTYEYDETAGQDQGGDVVEVLKMEKVIHFENVSVTFVNPAEEPEIAEYTDEPIYNVVGTNLDIEDATLLSCPQSKFNYIEYDPEAGTITNDQQIDIKELLPEEKSVDEERMEDSIVAISSETAHEIIVTVNNAHSEIEDAKTAGTITEDEYLEKKQIIETVTEASVVVGAGQTTASDEGKAVDNALPDDHDLGFTMDETLSEFYQLQMDYLLGRETIPEKQDPNKGALRLGDPLVVQGKIDLDVSKDDYAKMIGFVDTSVSNMKGAALQIRKCSSASMKAVVKSYISKVKISSFRDFDEEDANNKFVEAVSEAIMLNMQQQVIEALKRDHKPSNNAEKEMVYQQQLAACEDLETFKEIVLEVLRQKYVSLTKTEIAIDDFRPIYAKIFKSWALDDPTLNESGITLEQLTKATIETTRANANRFTYRESVTPQESTFLIVFGTAIAVGLGAAIATPVILSKTKHRRRAK